MLGNMLDKALFLDACKIIDIVICGVNVRFHIYYPPFFFFFYKIDRPKEERENGFGFSRVAENTLGPLKFFGLYVFLGLVWAQEGFRSNNRPKGHEIFLIKIFGLLRGPNRDFRPIRTQRMVFIPMRFYVKAFGPKGPIRV